MTRLLFFVWISAIVVFVLLAVLGMSDQVRLYYSNILQTLTAATAGLLALSTMEAFPSASPLRKSWGLIGAGTLAWAVGSAIFAGYPLLHEGVETPYPYFSDLGFLLTSPLITLGLYTFKREAGLKATYWGIGLALLLLLVGGYWGFLANSEDLMTGSPVTRLTAAGYTLFDPILLAMTALIATSFRGGALGKAWMLVLVGSVFYVIGNQLYSYFVGLETYHTGSLVDLAWVVGFGLIGCGAVATKNLLR